jgi:hypothetical protein
MAGEGVRGEDPKYIKTDKKSKEIYHTPRNVG